MIQITNDRRQELMTKINKGNSNSKNSNRQRMFVVLIFRFISIRLRRNANFYLFELILTNFYCYGDFLCKMHVCFELIRPNCNSPRQSKCQNYHNTMLKSNLNTSMYATEKFVVKTWFYFRTKFFSDQNERKRTTAHRTWHMQHHFSNIQKYRDNSHSAINHLREHSNGYVVLNNTKQISKNIAMLVCKSLIYGIEFHECDFTAESLIQDVTNLDFCYFFYSFQGIFY